MEADVVVIGAGLVGSAVTRHLAENGADVLCVGAPNGGPPYSSHDDDARITRVLDGSHVWAELARRSIDRYPDLERRSGISFHHPVGVLWVASEASELNEMQPVGRRLGVDTVESPDTPWSADLALPETDVELLERGGAGFVDPRAMRAAQLALAERAGARRIEGTVVGFERAARGWAVRTEDGATLPAGRLVVATGAAMGFLTGLDVVATAEAVVLADVPEEIGEAWAGRPCVGRLADGVVDFYLTPPRLVNGRWLMKVGSESATDTALGSPAEVNAWMSGEGLETRRQSFESMLSRIFPNLPIVEAVVRPCRYARTSRRRPLIAELEDGLVVAGGGNGRAAKSSDALGAVAARRVVSGEWDDALPESEFRG